MNVYPSFLVVFPKWSCFWCNTSTKHEFVFRVVFRIADFSRVNTNTERPRILGRYEDGSRYEKETPLLLLSLPSTAPEVYLPSDSCPLFVTQTTCNMVSKTKRKKRHQTAMDRDSVESLVRDGSDRITLTPVSVKRKFGYLSIFFDRLDSDYVICKKCANNELIRYNTKTGLGTVREHVESHIGYSASHSNLKQGTLDRFTRRRLSNRVKSLS